MTQVSFHWKHHDNAELWGSMNNWTTGHKLVSNAVTLKLNQGTYEYKFKIGNQWCYDITKTTIVDASGNINNVKIVESENIITIVHISDTHSLYYDTLPDGDILVHTGDFSIGGHFSEYEIFNEWLDKFDHKIKLIVLGNHDLDYYTEKNIDPLSEANVKLKNARVLNHKDGITNISGINFYAREWYHAHQWDYRAKPNHPIKKNIYDIPSNKNVDVLLTHGPARGFLDIFDSGSQELLQQINITKPKLHLFGHIHCKNGIDVLEYNDKTKTIFVNSSSVCEDGSKIVNEPTVIKYDTIKNCVVSVNGCMY